MWKCYVEVAASGVEPPPGSRSPVLWPRTNFPPEQLPGFLTPFKAVAAAADTDVSQPHHCHPQLWPIIVSILIQASMEAQHMVV